MKSIIQGGAESVMDAAKAIYVSVELSQSTWLVTSFAPAIDIKMARKGLPVGGVGQLLTLVADLRSKVLSKTGLSFPVIIIQEAGLDGFWVHRVLVDEGLESYVVDATSIAVPRKARRAKTDRIDGELLVRALMAFKRGEPRACAMVRVPSHDEEDRRRLLREREGFGRGAVETRQSNRRTVVCSRYFELSAPQPRSAAAPRRPSYWRWPSASTVHESPDIAGTRSSRIGH